MRTLLTSIVAALLMCNVGLAGSKCCPAAKKQAAKAECADAKVQTADAKAQCADAKGCGLEMLQGKVDLTAEQAEKIKALQSECQEMKCSASGKKAYFTGLKDILTDEQLAACEEACKENGWQCPVGAEKVEASSDKADS